MNKWNDYKAQDSWKNNENEDKRRAKNMRKNSDFCEIYEIRDSVSWINNC